MAVSSSNDLLFSSFTVTAFIFAVAFLQWHFCSGNAAYEVRERLLLVIE
jgi:hypothetical protein